MAAITSSTPRARFLVSIGGDELQERGTSRGLGRTTGVTILTLSMPASSVAVASSIAEVIDGPDATH